MARKNKLGASLKQLKFAREYVESSGNGTQSALKTYDTKDPNTASMIASENLRKPIVQEAILDILERSGIDLDTVTHIHSRNMKQDKHLGVSQTAVQDAYKLHNVRGFTKADTQPTTQIAVIIDNT